MSDLPPPPVPSDCDLRGLSYMPLDAQRMRDSDLALMSTGDEFKAAVTLWCISWAQVPAASLPDDDRLLAALLRLDAKAWRKVKAVALRKWIKCSDGRLYHPVVAEKARDAWAERIKYRGKRDKDAERLRLWREGQKLTPEPPGNGDGNATETRFETLYETQPEEKGKGTGREGIIDNTTTDASALDFRQMLVEATEAAGAVLDRTSTGVLHARDLAALISPASGEPCTWPEVLDAIRMTAARQERKGKPLRSWEWVRDDAWALRDKRLNSAAPDVATVVPFRPGQTLADRIAEENAEAQRRAFARMDAEHG